jgi:FG-GAP-like repeat
MKTSLRRTAQMVLFTLAFSVPVFAREFLRSRPHSVAGHPLAVAVGHFNHDGIPDIVTVGGSDPGITAVSVLLGKGDGSFKQTVSTKVSSSASQFLAVADFNGDHLSDVVYSTFENAVLVLLAKGDGGFQPPVSYSVASRPFGVVSGDFDNDGATDIAVANSFDNAVSVFLGNGDGTFQPPATYASGAPFGMATGDFDGDGNLDLAATNGGTAAEVDVLLGNGDGSFQAPVSYSVGRAPAVEVTVADFNRDGKPDLGCMIDPGQVSVLLGNGDGSLQTPISTNAGISSSLAVADFNLDGRPDAVVTSNYLSVQYVAVLIGQGDGRFKLGTAMSATKLPARMTVATADFNQDGLPDIVAANEEYGLVEVFLNNGP